jgi:hypothetical protein
VYVQPVYVVASWPDPAEKEVAAVTVVVAPGADKRSCDEDRGGR